jgi:hypothetical protein
MEHHNLQQEHDLSTTKGTWNMHLLSLQQEHDLGTTEGTWNMHMNSLQQEHAQIIWNIHCFGLQQDQAINPPWNANSLFICRNKEHSFY